MAEFEQLVKAQRARVSLELRSPLRAGRALMHSWSRFRAGIPAGRELADAMLSRCYQGTEGRTHYRKMHFVARRGVAHGGRLVAGAHSLGRWVLT